MEYIFSGQAKLVVDVAQHRSQYSRLLQSSNTGPKAIQLAQNIVHIKRKFGYAEAEKRLAHKLIELTYLKEGDVYGMSLGDYEIRDHSFDNMRSCAH